MMLRCGVEVETFRYRSIPKILLLARYCLTCNDEQSIGDEVHFLTTCQRVKLYSAMAALDKRHPSSHDRIIRMCAASPDVGKAVYRMFLKDNTCAAHVRNISIDHHAILTFTFVSTTQYLSLLSGLKKANPPCRYMNTCPSYSYSSII